MIKATVTFHAGGSLPVVVGTSEDVKAPRGLAALEKQGWPVDENTTLAYKVWLAGKRQGDIPEAVQFEQWIETVADIDLKPSAKQIEEMVVAGTVNREQADYLLKQMESDSGEAVAPLA